MQLIDRHAQLKNVYDNPPEKARMTHGEWYRKCIYEAPTVEAKPVQHGRWITQHTDYGSKWNCSVCSISIRVGDGISFEIERFAFCPFCGSQMDLCTPTEVQLDEAYDVMMGGADNG